MNKLLAALSGVAMALSSGSAFAADLLSRPSEPIVPYSAPAQFGWTGAYIGLNAGAAFQNGNRANLAYTGFNYGLDSNSWRMRSGRSTAFAWGGTAGFNYQMGGVVLGVETDFNIANMSSRSTLERIDRIYDDWTGSMHRRLIAAQKRDIRSFGTLRARIGYLVAPQFMIYGTGGLAFANTQLNGTVDESIIFGVNGQSYQSKPDRFYSRRNKTEFGWTIGGGAEYAIDRNWSVKGEYLYTNLPSSKLTMVRGSEPSNYVLYAPTQQAYHTRQRNSFSLVRIGVNYRF